MPTDKQIAANRRNAQKCTGPNTPAGKAASRFNALKHGIDAKELIVFKESEEDLANLSAEYREQYQPANATERFLVDTVVNNEWRLRRLRFVEADLWIEEARRILAKKTRDEQDKIDREAEEEAEENEEEENEDGEDDKDDKAEERKIRVSVNGGEAFTAAQKPFIHLQRIVSSCERNFHRALKELVAAVDARPSVAVMSEPVPQPDSAAQAAQTIPTSAQLVSFCTEPKSHASTPETEALHPTTSVPKPGSNIFSNG